MLYTYFGGYFIFRINNEYKQTVAYWVLFLIAIFSIPIVSYFNGIKPVFGLGFGLLIFQSAGWISDVYYNRIKPPFPFLNFLAYFLFFPKYIAGPVERTENLYQQLSSNPQKSFIENLKTGFPLILLGLFKKVVVADNLIQESSLTNIDGYGSLYLIFFAVIHFVQIFADFSGMIDIVRGIAQLFGYELLINFNKPFASKGFRSYWNNWHISLSSWIFNYFFKPLSYALRHIFKSYTGAVLLFASFFLITSWHGLTANYLIFGLLHAGFILLETVFRINWINQSNPLLEFLTRIFFIILLSFITLFFSNMPLNFPVGIIKSIFNLSSILLYPTNEQLLVLVFNLGALFMLYFVGSFFERKLPLLSTRNILVLTAIIVLWPENPQTFIYAF
jgi:D-alanyl-lipoteichoic acid acyltransferase DltB (MBOAT superfamily)